MCYWQKWFLSVFYPLNSSPTQANHLVQLSDWLNLQYTWSSGVSITNVAYIHCNL